MIQQRKFKESDRSYITRTLLHSFLNGSKETQKIHKDSYLTAHNKTVNGLLDNCDCSLMVDSEEPDLIYGFIIYEHLKEYDVLHYIYVKKEFRDRGIARKMLESFKSSNEKLALSHLTDSFKPARMKKYYKSIAYDPYLISGAYRRLS